MPSWAPPARFSLARLWLGSWLKAARLCESRHDDGHDEHDAHGHGQPHDGAGLGGLRFLRRDPGSGA